MASSVHGSSGTWYLLDHKQNIPQNMLLYLQRNCAEVGLLKALVLASHPLNAALRYRRRLALHYRYLLVIRLGSQSWGLCWSWLEGGCRLADLGWDDQDDPALLCLGGSLIVRVEGKFKSTSFSYFKHVSCKLRNMPFWNCFQPIWPKINYLCKDIQEKEKNLQSRNVLQMPL